MLPATFSRRWRHFLNTCASHIHTASPMAIPPSRGCLCCVWEAGYVSHVHLAAVYILGIVSVSLDRLVTCLSCRSAPHGRFGALQTPLRWPLASTDVPTLYATSLFWAQTRGLLSTLAPASFHSSFLLSTE